VGRTDFTLEDAAPVHAVRCVKGPSRPVAPLGEGTLAWRFISHLSLNYLSLLDNGEKEGAEALRQMLELYAPAVNVAMRRQIEGVRSVRTRPSVRRLPFTGPLAYGRGIQIELEVEELAFEGGSAFLFGSVMEQFFARHVSINSFTETVLRSNARGEILRGTPRCGQRPIA
jgi:type VI secretion system protein ImpG